jgi:hypothetical protein
VTDWSINDAGGAEQCLYLVGKVRIYTLAPHLKEK